MESPLKYECYDEIGYSSDCFQETPATKEILFSEIAVWKKYLLWKNTCSE